jgi:hypothetical protein
MTEIVSVDIELEDLHEVGEAERREEIWHDASESFPAQTRPQGAESSIIQPNTSEGVADNNIADDKAKMSCTASTGIGTWVGAALSIGALIAAIYYGYWSLRLQQWSALKDFRSQCQEAEVDCISDKNDGIKGWLTWTTDKQHLDSRMCRGTCASTCSAAGVEAFCSKAL